MSSMSHVPTRVKSKRTEVRLGAERDHFDKQQVNMQKDAGKRRVNARCGMGRGGGSSFFQACGVVRRWRKIYRNNHIPSPQIKCCELPRRRRSFVDSEGPGGMPSVCVCVVIYLQKDKLAVLQFWLFKHKAVRLKVLLPLRTEVSPPVSSRSRPSCLATFPSTTRIYPPPPPPFF